MRSLSSKASGCIFPRKLLATPSVSPQVQKNQRIMKDLAQKTLANLPEKTVENFKKVISALNQIVQTWKNR
jgi:hypothetical protein